MLLKSGTKKANSVHSGIQLILLSLIGTLFFACSTKNKPDGNTVMKQDVFALPKVTFLANLPDSIKPKQIFLNTVPKPLTIGIPFKTGAGYIRQTVGGPKKIKLFPALTHRFIDSITHLPIEADGQGKGFFSSYTTDNGLAYDEIYCCFKDKAGNLWFGTNGGGVSKYDGKSFTNYTTAHGLASNVVWSITQDKKGDLWFGTDGSGASKYDGKIFTNFSTAQGLASNVIYNIFCDKNGNLWFGTLGGGVSKYDGEHFTNITTAQGLTNNSVRCIIEDKLGNLWFGTNGGGVSKYDGKSFTNYITTQGLANNAVWSIAEDNNGNLWFGTDGSGASKYDGKKFINYSISQGLANNVVCSILCDKSGNLWFGTLGGGVSRYDGKRFTNFTTAQGLTNNSVRCIIEDDPGNLWLGTFGGGVSKYQGKSFTNYTMERGLGNSAVYSINEDMTGNLWFGTNGGGVNKYDGNGFKEFTMSQGLSSNIVYSIGKDRFGNLWFGTSGGGVCKYDGKSFVNYTTAQGLANNVVFNIIEDKTGNLWFGTSGGGVSKYDGKSFTNYTKAQGLAGNVVYSIAEDEKGNLWFGTFGGGVSKYDGKSFTNFTTDQGLANNVVWCITNDKKGNLWFGTQEGLSLLSRKLLSGIHENKNGKNFFKEKLFKNFTTKDGLPDNFVTQVTQDDDENLFVGTNLGICELSDVNSSDNNGKRWVVSRTFNSLTGYPIKDVNVGPGALFKDSKDIFWIGTGSDKTGLVRFDPKAIITTNQTPSTLVIQSVKINNENICWNDLSTKPENSKLDSNSTSPNITEEVSTFGRALSDRERDSIRKKFSDISFDSITKWYPIPENLVLPHKHNNISFDFNAIETGKNFVVKYQYMLEGYDKDWSPPTNKTSASFGNIYEGTHTFKVKAQSPDGVWSKPANYTFKVLPPWWRTWWMYTVYAILAIALIILFVWWNNRRIIAQKKILEHKITIATKQIREERDKVEEQKKKIEETLSELKTTQNQLIQSEKMASLGELTAGIAHEIQNPLNFVNNFSEVSNELMDEMNIEIEKGNTTEAKVIADDIKQNLEKIAHHGKRADAIVKGMLQHSRGSTGIKEPTDINALADESARLCYHGQRAKDNTFNVTLKTDFDPTIGKIKIIPQDIGRVLLNLINNAFYSVIEKKKMHPAGYEPIVSVKTKKINDKIEIRVSDNGSGVPKKVLDKIFQPFFTTKPTGVGTGLGLSLSYDITKAHGGEIKLETKEGEGAEFIILIPA